MTSATNRRAMGKLFAALFARKIARVRVRAHVHVEILLLSERLVAVGACVCEARDVIAGRVGGMVGENHVNNMWRV